MTEDKLIEMIYASIDRINEQLGESEKIAKSHSTILTGSGSNLESLTLVTLIVDIEESISKSAVGHIDIVNDGIMAEAGPRFSTVSELARWILAKTT